MTTRLNLARFFVCVKRFINFKFASCLYLDLIGSQLWYNFAPITERYWRNFQSLTSIVRRSVKIQYIFFIHNLIPVNFL